MSYDISSISPDSYDAWKPEPGDTLKGEILYIGDFTGTSYDGSKRERKLRIDVETDNGDYATIYAVTDTDVDNGGWAKRLAKAIGAAVRAAGETTLEIGGTIAVKRINDTATDRGPAKAYQAQYKPPVAAVPAAADTASADGAVTDLI